MVARASTSGRTHWPWRISGGTEMCPIEHTLLALHLSDELQQQRLEPKVTTDTTVICVKGRPCSSLGVAAAGFPAQLITSTAVICVGCRTLQLFGVMRQQGLQPN